MKILHICMNAPFTENYSYQDNLLTEYQHKHGHDIFIITTTRTRDRDGKIINIEPEKKVLDNGTTLLRMKMVNKILRILGIYPRLYKVMEEFEPDMIFIHGLCSCIPNQAVRYKKLHPAVHIVADNHQDLGTTKVEEFPFSIVLALHRFGWKKWIRNVDCVYGTTSWRKTFAHDYYGIPYEKLDVLIMGIDSDKNPQNPEYTRKKIRTQLGIPEDSFVFVTGGKLDNNKNIIVAMKSFMNLKNQNSRFLIFGSVAKEIESDFFKIIENDQRFIYIGYIKSEAVREYFFASDFGVFPGRHSVLWEEAIGSGLPCLFKRYEKQDHTEVCGNCICLKNTDEETITEIINRLLYDKQYYGMLHKNALEAASVFSYHDIARKSVECCEKMNLKKENKSR